MSHMGASPCNSARPQMRRKESHKYYENARVSKRKQKRPRTFIVLDLIKIMVEDRGLEPLTS